MRFQRRTNVTNPVVIGGRALLLAAALVVGVLGGGPAPFTAAAHAAEDHADHGSGKGKMVQQGKGSGSGTHGGSHDVEGTILRGKHGRDASVLHDDDDGEDSDRPPWAGVPGGEGRPGGGGNVNPGVSRGDLYGDMYEILRDENGVPILTEINGEYYVQPVDENGEPLELDEDGHLVNEDAAIEVELSRLNVARAPDRVIERAFEEVMTAIAEAEEIATDVTGRLVLYDADTDTTKTIDAPIENLALYIDAMTDGGNLDSGIDWSAEQAAAFLAAAADKFGTATVDSVQYTNALLGITGSLEAGDGSTYVDYTNFTYDRDIYDTTVKVLQQQEDGSYTTVEVNLKDEVLGGDFTGSNVDAFATAVDDAIQVIEFVHEYAEFGVPE